MKDKIKANILKKIKDIEKKVKENEPLPHGPQDIHLLVHIDDKLDEILNAWYY